METPRRDSTSAERPAETWLTPSEALNRFEPPAGTLFEAGRATEERTRYGFRIGTLNLLIHSTTGSEVIPMAPLSAVPNTPHWLIGILNLRGNLVPVFDLRLALGLEDQDRGVKPMVLVLDKGNKAVGMIVEGPPQALIGMHRLQRLPQLPPKLESCVSAGYLKDEALWLEFDHKDFFSALVSA